MFRLLTNASVQQVNHFFTVLLGILHRPYSNCFMAGFILTGQSVISLAGHCVIGAMACDPFIILPCRWRYAK